MASTKPKVLVILGQTSTGKSGLAVLLALRLLSGQAKKFGITGAEIISADSRQIYKGMNIGTGKITSKEMNGIKHHMLDILSPKNRYSVAEWQKETKKIIADILSREKLPIICGGTGLYIKSVVDNIVLPEVPPNQKLRGKLEKKNIEKLFQILKKLDPERAKIVDRKNPRRLIRAIEIATALGKVPKISTNKNPYQFLQIGLKLPDKILKEKIHNRLLARVKRGMLNEGKKLHLNGLPWKRMEELGLEYKYISQLLQKKITKKEFLKQLETEIWGYARRQNTWFKRDKKIKWFNPSEHKKIEREVLKFLSSKAKPYTPSLKV